MQNQLHDLITDCDELDKKLNTMIQLIESLVAGTIAFNLIQFIGA